MRHCSPSRCDRRNTVIVPHANRTCRALMSALIVLLLAAPLAAQAPTSATEKAAAEALFDEALGHLKQQRYEQACLLLERSQRIDPAVGTLLYLAECYERTQRFASAWATFREAASLADASSQPERATVGRERAQQLEPRLPRVALEVAEGNAMEGFELTRNGETVKPALFGIPVPLDPGSYELVARAPDHQPWQLTLEVNNEAVLRRIVVPRLTPSSAPSVAPPAEPLVSSNPTGSEGTSLPLAASEPTSSPRSGASTQETIGWVSGTFGLIGVVAGVGFGVRAATLDRDAEQHCEAQRCWDERGAELSDDARRAAMLANISYGVGGAALLTSLILLLTAPDSEDRAAPSVHLAPDMALRGGRVTLQGQF